MEILGFREWLNQNTELNEMATDRKKAEQVINSLGDEVFQHIIKILYWKDDINFEKHCNDINTWLFKIQDIELKPNSKRIPEKDYYFWLYDEFFSSKKQLESTIKRKLKSYHNLPRTELDIDKLHTFLDKTYKQIAKDLAVDKFEDIRYYLS